MDDLGLGDPLGSLGSDLAGYLEGAGFVGAGFEQPFLGKKTFAESEDYFCLCLHVWFRRTRSWGLLTSQVSWKPSPAGWSSRNHT